MRRAALFGVVAAVYFAGVFTGVIVWKVGSRGYLGAVFLKSPLTTTQETSSRAILQQERIPLKTLAWDWDWPPPYTYVSVTGVVKNLGAANANALLITVLFKHATESSVDSAVLDTLPPIDWKSVSLPLKQPLQPNEIARFETVVEATDYFPSSALPSLLWALNVQKGRGDTGSSIPANFRVIQGSAHVTIRVEGLP